MENGISIWGGEEETVEVNTSFFRLRRSSSHHFGASAGGSFYKRRGEGATRKKSGLLLPYPRRGKKRGRKWEKGRSWIIVEGGSI